mmetsp:Transcript_126301/g.363288  ORF Transcript_126301/g.363288 Transcript_126301/m.363288 type:complete len:234 (-) Transcript_126301:6-707(-)
MQLRWTLLAIFALCCQRQVLGEAIQLTVENFSAQVDGKNVFIKFFAPWCAHCRAMSEDWDKLAVTYANHPLVVIAKVDCTSDEGQPICQDFDIQGFPTLVYGDPMSAETYEGQRDYDSLFAWAEEHVTKPICSIYKQENCSPEVKTMIEKLEAMSDDDLEGIVSKVEQRVKEQEAAFDAKVSVIQQQYDKYVKEFNANLDKIKDEFNYKYIEQILDIRHAESSTTDSETSEEL